MLKFNIDGCLTVMLHFWKNWLDREIDSSTALAQRVAFVLPLLHLKERSLDVQKESGLFSQKIEEWCQREKLYVNFEEKQHYLVITQAELAQGTMFAVYNGWMHKNNQEHVSTKQ